jgi:hypothetical protein
MLDERRDDESCPRRPGIARRLGLATALVAALGASGSAWAEDRNVVVYISGPQGAELQADATGDGDWQTVCHAPCDRPLSLAPSYRIHGDRIRSSDAFRLTGGPDQITTLHVRSASDRAFVGGIVLISGGLVATVAGVLIGFAEMLTSVSPCPDAATTGNEHCASAANGWPGWVTAGVGFAGVLGGALLTNNNTSSTVTQSTQPAAATAAPAASIPLPTWREPLPAAKAVPPLSAVPLWTARF